MQHTSSLFPYISVLKVVVMAPLDARIAPPTQNLFSRSTTWRPHRKNGLSTISCRPIQPLPMPYCPSTPEEDTQFCYLMKVNLTPLTNIFIQIGKYQLSSSLMFIWLILPLSRRSLYFDLKQIHLKHIEHVDFEPRNVVKRSRHHPTIIDFSHSIPHHDCGGDFRCEELRTVYIQLRLHCWKYMLLRPLPDVLFVHGHWRLSVLFLALLVVLLMFSCLPFVTGWLQ